MLEIQNGTGDLIKPEHSPLAFSLELPPWIDIVAFASTTWDDADERPRRLMTRFARNHRVFFFQEPKQDALDDPYLEFSIQDRVRIVIPHLNHSDSASERNKEKMIGLLLSLAEIHQYIFWYFSPLAVEYTSQFSPRCTVYDCMNETFRLRDAFPDIYENCRRKLTSWADLIFTTDLSLCLDPGNFRRNVHLFANSKNPTGADWDTLYRSMSRLVYRSFRRVHPGSNLIDPQI